MRVSRTTFSVLAAILASTSSAAYAQDGSASSGAPADEDETARKSGDIVVTARRREESLQDVPVAVSVLSSETLDAKGTFTPVDLVQSTPGLAVTATISDRNNVTYTIRGQGYAFGTVFPAVITYFNEVPVPTIVTGAFFDLGNVQVLRGPQGVNFGRVTNGGNVMLSPQLPTNEFGGYAGVKLGNYGMRTVNGAINLPLVDDKVMVRAAFETARRDGFTTNVFDGADVDNVAYDSYRVGLTLRPVDGLENTTVINYQKTDDNGTGVIFTGLNSAAFGSAAGGALFAFGAPYAFNANGDIVTAGTPGSTPLNAGNLLNPAIPGSLAAQLAAQNARGPREVNLTNATFDRRKNLYIVNTTKAQITDDIELTNVFGYIREEHDALSMYVPVNGDVNIQCRSECGGLPFNDREQFSEELRLSGTSFGGKLNWVVGVYGDEQRPSGQYQNATRSLGVIDRRIVNYITTTSRAAYGSLEYQVTDNLSINGGIRYTRDTIHSEQTNYLSLAPLPGAQAAFATALTGPLGAALNGGTPFPLAVANGIAAATYAPIPDGQCVTFGAGSFLYGGVAAPCQVIDAKYNATTWTFGANYKTGSGQLLYAKVSKGYRPGGVNSTAGNADPRYNPETDISIELGAKGKFDLGTVPVTANVAVYRDRYKGIQKIIVSTVGGTNFADVRNVNDAVVKGLEFDGTIGPVSGITLGGTFAYTDAKYDRDSTNVFADNVDGVGACNPNAFAIGAKFCAFNRFNATPKVQYTISLNYALPLPEEYGEFTIGGLLYHQSSASLNDSSRLTPSAIEPAYTTIDLSANWRNVMGQPIDLGFFVTNVTDELYRIGTNDLSQNSSLGTRGDIYAAPQMWGFSLKYRFGNDAE